MLNATQQVGKIKTPLRMFDQGMDTTVKCAPDGTGVVPGVGDSGVSVPGAEERRELVGESLPRKSVLKGTVSFTGGHGRSQVTP
jgi:hypothetical protein